MTSVRTQFSLFINSGINKLLVLNKIYIVSFIITASVATSWFSGGYDQIASVQDIWQSINLSIHIQYSYSNGFEYSSIRSAFKVETMRFLKVACNINIE